MKKIFLLLIAICLLAVTAQADAVIKVAVVANGPRTVSIKTGGLFDFSEGLLVDTPVGLATAAVKEQIGNPYELAVVVFNKDDKPPSNKDFDFIVYISELSIDSCKTDSCKKCRYRIDFKILNTRKGKSILDEQKYCEGSSGLEFDFHGWLRDKVVPLLKK